LANCGLEDVAHVDVCGGGNIGFGEGGFDGGSAELRGRDCHEAAIELGNVSIALKELKRQPDLASRRAGGAEDVRISDLAPRP